MVLKTIKQQSFIDLKTTNQQCLQFNIFFFRILPQFLSFWNEIEVLQGTHRSLKCLILDFEEFFFSHWKNLKIEKVFCLGRNMS